MTLPVRHRPGSLLEPIAAEFEELFERMNRLLPGQAAEPRHIEITES
ncbi:hypothetical protein ACH47Z_06640 [Streptomyces sp. NPDC020192]